MPFEFGEEPVNAMEMVLVTCVISKGDLPVKIQWFFNGQVLKSGQNGVALANTKKTSQLTIESVSHQNQGIYACVVKNDAGTVNHTAQLFVNGTYYNRVACSFTCVCPLLSSIPTVTLAAHKEL